VSFIRRASCVVRRPSFNVPLSFLVLLSSAQAMPLPLQAMANLKKLRSFDYTLVMSRTEPPQVSGSFTGAVYLPDTQEQIGSWNGQPMMHVKARGDVEYVRTESTANCKLQSANCKVSSDTAWSVQERDEEGSLLAQVERVIILDSFKPAGEDDRTRSFTFKPNLVFLDPTLTKKLIGRFTVLRAGTLPEEISVSSADNTIAWRAEFTDYNRAPPITFPFARQWQVTLVADTSSVVRRASCVVRRSSFIVPASPPPRVSASVPDSAILRRRFQTLGFATQTTARGDTLTLFLEQEVRPEVLKALVQPGRAEIWIGHRSEEVFSSVVRRPSSVFRLPDDGSRVTDDGRRVTDDEGLVSGDSSQAVVFERRAFDAGDLASLDVDDSAGAPVMVVTPTREAASKIARSEPLDNSGLLWVFTVDGDAFGVAEISKSQGAIRFAPSGLQNPQVTRALTAIIESGPLTNRFRITDVKKAK
jgi:hypothetical protein